MPDNFTLLGIVVFGVLFIVSGVISITRKKITFTYQKGTINPVFVASLRGICALTYGGFALVGGACMILPAAYVLLLKNSVGDGVITLTSAVGIGIFIIGLLFSAVMQILLNRGEKLKQDSIK